MRSLDSALEAAQKKSTLEPTIRITLSHSGEDDIVLETDKVLSLNQSEEPYRQSAEVSLDNSEGYFTELDVKGWQAVISWGLVTKDGKKYSDTAPLWVISQQLDSSQGRLTCEFRMVGIPNMLAEDRASEAYYPRIDKETEEWTPAGSQNKTVKDLLNEIIGATIDCFSHCHAYEVVWDDGYDTLANTYKPKDGFRIYSNNSRLAAIRRLLDFTQNVMRIGNDGKIHILKPTISGVSYNYEYSLETGHTFFSKAYRKTLCIPNYIVVESKKDDDPFYEGFAKDQDSIDAFREVRQYFKTSLESDGQADDIAEAILSKYQLNAEMGAFSCPMNVGQEIFDYVKVTDEREDDYRKGNIGSITRKYNAEKSIYNMQVSFGGWLTVRGLASNLSVYPDGVEQHLNEMWIENLYANYIYSNIIEVSYLSALCAHMGLLTGGEIRVGAGADGKNEFGVSGLDKDGGTATGGSSTTVVDTSKAWEVDALKGLAVRIVIEPEVYKSGKLEYIQEYPYYESQITSNTATTITFAPALPAGITVSAGDKYAYGAGDFTGWRLWAENNIDGHLGRMAGFSNGVMQFYMGSDGKLYAGMGTVVIDENGVSISGKYLKFTDSNGENSVYIWNDVGDPSNSIRTDANSFIVSVIVPTNDDTGGVGTADKKYYRGHFSGRLQIPVGTDMYD